MPLETPNTARELEHWLDLNCRANGKSKNLTSFAGNCFHPDGSRISNTACGWYLYDHKRNEFAEHFVRIYNSTPDQVVLPCINMVIPQGDEWIMTPFVDIEFPSDEIFQVFLNHRGIQEWEFYIEVRSEFRNVLGLPNDPNDANFAFSRQPSKRYKFHIVYTGNADIRWSKEEQRTSLKTLGSFFTELYNLKELENREGPMVPETLNDEGMIVPAKHWVKGFSNLDTFELCSAAFVDDTVHGLRPLGNAKAHDTKSKSDVYQVYLLDNPSHPQMPMTKNSFLNHLILPVGEEHKRVPILSKKNPELNPDLFEDVGSDTSSNSQIMGNISTVKNAGPSSAPHHIDKVQQWLPEIDRPAVGGSWLKSDSMMERNNSPSSVSSQPKMKGSKGLKGKNKRPFIADVGSETSSSHSKRNRTRVEEDPFRNPLRSTTSSSGTQLKLPYSREQLLHTITKKSSCQFDPKARDINSAQSAIGGDKYKKPPNPRRPKAKYVLTSQAARVLQRFVILHPKLPWGHALMQGDRSTWKTIGHLAATSMEESGKDAIEEALRVLGIYSQPITKTLANLINEALVKQSPEHYASILQHLVGSNKKQKTQGRIEVEGDGNISWYIYSQERHGWKKLEGGNYHATYALRGILVAYREYLIRYAKVIDETFEDDAQANSWFDTSSEEDYHPVLHCYNTVYDSIVGGRGTRTCTPDVLKKWESMIRSQCIIPNGSISEVLNEDRLKIAFTNGIFDLCPHGKEGYKLRPGRPNDFTSFRFECKYYDYNKIKDDPRFKPYIAQWKKFFSELFPDKNVTVWIFRVLASCLGGNPPDLLFILTGAGSNGKSIFLHLLETTFGIGNGYYVTISSTKLTEKKTHSANADPQQFKLKGKRVRADTEPPENVPLNVSYIKDRFDTQTIRQLYEGSVREQNHFYKHFLACNTTPPSSGEEANTRRLVHIEMPTGFHYVVDKDNLLDKKIDDSLKRQIPLWRESLLSYLVALWQQHQAGHKTKTDPLKIMVYPPSIGRLNMRMLHNNDVASNFLHSDLVKNRYGCMESKEIWKAYVEKWRAEYPSPEDQRLFQKMSREQFERLVIKNFGTCKRVTLGPDKGEYYACIRRDTPPEHVPTRMDSKLKNYEDGMDPDLLSSLLNPGYDLPDVDGYDQKAVGDDSSLHQVDPACDSDDENNGSVINLDSSGEDSLGNYRPASDGDTSDDDSDYDVGNLPPDTPIHRASGNPNLSSDSDSESQQLSVSRFSQLSHKSDHILHGGQSRKRTLTRRLLHEISSVSGESDESEDEHTTPNLIILPSAKHRKIQDSDSEADQPPAGPPASNTLVVSAPAALPIKKRKRSKIHRNINKFIEEGANVSDDQGESDEAKEDEQIHSSDIDFLDDRDSDEISSAKK